MPQFLCIYIGGIACWLESRTCDKKVESSNPGRSSWTIFFSSQFCVLILIRYPLHSRVTAVARKRPGHSAKSAGDRLHQNTHTPLTQRSRSGLICRCPARKEKATTTILIPIILYLPHYSLRVYSSQTIYLSIVD